MIRLSLFLLVILQPLFAEAKDIITKDEVKMLCEEVFAYAEQQIPFMVEYVDNENAKSELSRRHISNFAFRTLLFIYPFWNINILESIGLVKSKGETKKIMPIALDDRGEIVMASIYDWRSGFYPGILWLMYEYTHQQFYRDKALVYTRKLNPVLNYSKHDLGFMINNSYGKAYKELNRAEFKEALLLSAKTLRNRYNGRVHAIKSWNTSNRWSFPVIIDNMMNLELLFHATPITGDSTFYRVAEHHARTTMRNHFRDDYSSYHVVDYDSVTGIPRRKGTSQGFSDESFWSRGQAWGLYGYTMCFRYTHDQLFLNQAVGIADFILSQKYASDRIPYWDMKCPISKDTPRDASSACIMASALLELCSYVKSPLKDQYYSYAYKLLSSLHYAYQSRVGENHGFLLMHSTSDFKRNVEVDVPLIYADYYYLEAILRLLNFDYTA